MKKFILAGTGNDGFWHKYHIDKSKGFREAFIRFMTFLGFERKEIQSRFNQKYESDDDDGEYIATQWVVDADEISDEIWHFKNEKYDIDVFFGEDKIFVIVRTKNRENMIDTLRDDVSWKSDEESEKIRKENREKMKQKALKELTKRNKSAIKIKK